MIDLETYRSRIGSFSSDHQHCSNRNKGSHFGKVQKGSFSFKILFLIIITLSKICVSQDPSVAKTLDLTHQDLSFMNPPREEVILTGSRTQQQFNNHNKS